MSDNTLRDRFNEIRFYQATSKMTEFEKNVMHDIIDHSDSVFGIGCLECVENIKLVAKRYWDSKLNTGGMSEWLKETSFPWL